MSFSTLIRRARGGAALAGALLLTSACVVAPVPGYYGEVVTVAPPPMRAEVIGVAPYPGSIWISGYWGWSGGRHQWVPGRWERPHPGHRWTPHRWEQVPRGWRERPGRWERY